MKTRKITVFLLVIFFSLNNLFGQNLYLEAFGKDSLETKIINSIDRAPSFKNYASLKIEIDSILTKLQKAGYLESELLSTSKKQDSITEAFFSLNNKFDTIYIYTNNFIPDDLLSDINLENSDNYLKVPLSEINNTLNELNKLMAENGDPFVSFQLINIRKKDNKNLEADLEVISTKVRTIDNIVIKGYEKFPKSYLNRYIKLNKEQIFNYREIENKAKQLNTLPFVKQTRDPEALFEEDSTSIYLYLEKKPANSFDGFLGFGTNENSTKLKFNGYLNLNLTNNLNYGESLNLIYKSDENEQRSININANLPYLFKTPLGTELNLNIFKKDSTFNSVSQSAKLYYQINSATKVYSGIEATNSNYLQEDISLSNIDDYKSTFYSVSFEYKNPTNNILFPIKDYINIGSNFGNRKIDNTSQNQTALFFKGFKIFNLNPKNSIYLNTEGKMLFSDSYLTNELYRFGGINSIRGFEENSLYASLYSVINSEYRYMLSNSIYINSILDAAYYENKITDIKEKLFGFGIGLAIITKTGLLKLNYANGLIEKQAFNFKNSKVHISLNTSF